MPHPLTRFAMAVLSLMLLTVPATAKRVKLKVGDPAPVWESLPGTDGAEHSLVKLKDAKAIVILFMSNECPVAQAYEERVSKLATDFAKQKVAVLAINPNKDETLGAMKRHAKQRKLAYAYLRDESQKVARSFGALRTPEVFLIDEKGKIVYMGAIDNDVKLNGKPTRDYLRNAIISLLAGKEIREDSTRAMGCTIRWK